MLLYAGLFKAVGSVVGWLANLATFFQATASTQHPDVTLVEQAQLVAALQFLERDCQMKSINWRDPNYALMLGNVIVGGVTEMRVKADELQAAKRHFGLGITCAAVKSAILPDGSDHKP